MLKTIRQSILTIFMVGVLLSVTTLSTFAGSWHSGNVHYWTVQAVCPGKLDLASVWNETGGAVYPPPFDLEWEAYVWMGTMPDVPGAIDPVDGLSSYLGDVTVTVQAQPSPIIYEPVSGTHQKSLNWGDGSIIWESGIASAGDLIFLRFKGSQPGWVLEVQDCGGDGEDGGGGEEK